MTWLSTTVSIIAAAFSCLVLPLKLLFQVLLILLAPATYLGSYGVAAVLLPFKVLARFETLYIYLGVAAIVGLFAGSILHFSSTILISLLNLTPESQEEEDRPVASVGAAKEAKTLEDAWEASTTKKEPESWREEMSARRKQTEWLDIDRGRRRQEKGLLGQTILEEDDDSEDGI